MHPLLPSTKPVRGGSLKLATRGPSFATTSSLQQAVAEASRRSGISVRPMPDVPNYVVVLGEVSVQHTLSPPANQGLPFGH